MWTDNFENGSLGLVIRLKCPRQWCGVFSCRGQENVWKVGGMHNLQEHPKPSGGVHMTLGRSGPSAIPSAQPQPPNSPPHSLVHPAFAVPRRPHPNPLRLARPSLARFAVGPVPSKTCLVRRSPVV